MKALTENYTKFSFLQNTTPESRQPMNAKIVISPLSGVRAIKFLHHRVADTARNTKTHFIEN